MAPPYPSVRAVPIADESDFSSREYDAQIECIESNTPDLDTDKAPDGWADKVFSYLWDHDYYFDDCWIDEKYLLEAIRALGWAEPVEI